VGESRSNDPGGGQRPPPPEGAGPAELFARLYPSERLAALGALAIPVTLGLPWYGIPISNLAQTGGSSFGWAHAALLLTAGAVLFLLWRVARGYELPRPLTVGGLLAVAGTWATLLVIYLMVERPDELAGYGRVNLRYGILIAAAASLAILVGARHPRRRGTNRSGTPPGVPLLAWEVPRGGTMSMAPAG
jgi:hypothetical protein